MFSGRTTRNDARRQHVDASASRSWQRFELCPRIPLADTIVTVCQVLKIRALHHPPVMVRRGTRARKGPSDPAPRTPKEAVAPKTDGGASQPASFQGKLSHTSPVQTASKKITVYFSSTTIKEEDKVMALHKVFGRSKGEPVVKVFRISLLR